MSKDSLKKKIDHLSIQKDASISEALRLMDKIDKKLLMVINSSDEFTSLVSVGDIQRYLIKTQNLNAKVSDVLRPNIRVAKDTQSKDQIKAEMLKFRMEFMPILNKNNELVNVLFWDDLFHEDYENNSTDLNIPVVIMAGGKGTRLKPITNVIPKPLIPIGQETIMEHIMNRFTACKVEKFYATVNYKSDMIKSYFDKSDYDIEYLDEKIPLGTAGSLSLLRGKIDTAFFVSNCDILIKQDYGSVYNFHKENKNEMTIIGAIKNYSIPYGTLNVSENGLLNSVQEKPNINFMVNTGMYILEPHLIDEIPVDTFFHITDLMDSILKRNGRIGVFPVGESSWMDIGNWNEYNETLKKLGESTFL